MTETISTPRIEQELLPSKDPLSDVLRSLKLTGVLYCRAELTAPWGIALPRLPGVMMIQIVNAGGCWLDIAGQPSQRLAAGGLALMPHGTPHQIRSRRDADATPLSEVPVQLAGDRYEVMCHGGGGELTRITYCGVRFNPVAAQRLLDLLPRMLLVDTVAQDDDWLGETVRFISREADERRPGSETIITRLADVVVIQAIRSWLSSAQATDRGWLAAIRDKHVGRALAAIHRAPELDWTVGALAEAASLSRSGFSARFTQLVGQPAMKYLTEWRMQLARELLIETSDPLAVLADRLGYQSEAVFSRAFKRVFGVAPGAVRKSPAIGSG